MIIKEERILTDEDKILLSQPFPVNPCIKCINNPTTCCGCPKKKSYEKNIQQYKDNKIFKYAKMINELKNIDDEIASLLKRKSGIKAKLPSEFIEFI